MYDLTQLEGIGFQFTPLERTVFTHPSFQFLFGRGWPIKWGSLTTGLTAEVNLDKTLISFKPIEGEKLTPHRSGIFVDELSSHIRSTAILIAKVARDASDDRFDQRLMQDLSVWFDGKITYPCKPFRWAEFEQKHVEMLRKDARKVEVTTLAQGDADVVILFLDMLAMDQRERIQEAVKADCIKREIFDDTDEHRESRHYHLPRTNCVLCNETPSRSGWRHCDNFTSITLVDCGDVPTIVKSIPADFRRIIKPVRFKVPRSTFSDESGRIGASLFPQFAVFSLSLLSEEERQKLRLELHDSLRNKKLEWTRHYGPGYYTECQVIAPAGRQKLNALLLAGPATTWNSWALILDKNDFWHELRRNKKIKVELIN